MIGEYSHLMLNATELLIHQDRKDYQPEVPLMQLLANHMTIMNWNSVTKGLGPTRPDMRTTSPDKSVVVTTHAKQFVLDYPTRIQSGAKWDGSLARQHLGIRPGKSNNAVDDVLVKLEAVRSGTHVSFLLVRFATVKFPGDNDVQEFVELAKLNDGRWASFTRDWTHPTDPTHHVNAYLWCRPIPDSIRLPV